MYILVMTNKSNTQLYKMVIYDKPIKKVKAKINRMNPKHNRLTVKGDTKYLSNVIESIYKSMREPDFSFESESMLIEIKPFIRSKHSYYNIDDETMSKEKLIKEYKRLVKENIHNVLQYNLIREPKCLICNDTGINTHIEKDDIGLKKEVDYPCQCKRKPKGSKVIDAMLNYVENLKD